jgi:hypothetical protein
MSSCSDPVFAFEDRDPAVVVAAVAVPDQAASARWAVSQAR